MSVRMQIGLNIPIQIWETRTEYSDKQGRNPLHVYQPTNTVEGRDQVLDIILIYGYSLRLALNNAWSFTIMGIVCFG